MQALQDIGVPAKQIEKLRKNKEPETTARKLADKSVFLEALLKLIDELLCVALCQTPIKLHIFSTDKGEKIVINPTR